MDPAEDDSGAVCHPHIKRPVFACVLADPAEFCWLPDGRLFPWADSYRSRAKGTDPRLADSLLAAWWLITGEGAPTITP